MGHAVTKANRAGVKLIPTRARAVEGDSSYRADCSTDGGAQEIGDNSEEWHEVLVVDRIPSTVERRGLGG